MMHFFFLAAGVPSEEYGEFPQESVGAAAILADGAAGPFRGRPGLSGAAGGLQII